MDSLTHTFFGLALYGAVNKEQMTKKEKGAILTTALVSSHIPDIDVISRLWDTEGMYQMWHRGLTHSLFLVPLWALLIWLLIWLIFKDRRRLILKLALLGVFIHSTIDLFNAWGTGYFEPFSAVRITFGTIPIVDFVIWGILLLAFIMTRAPIKRVFRASWRSFKVFRLAWLLIALHVFIQSAQGYVLYQQYQPEYERVALSASFLPWHFTVVGAIEDSVELVDAALWKEPVLREVLYSATAADLVELFEGNPAAKTLYQWSPFVVIVDDESYLGIYDPRFYRDGQSFLFEYIER